MKFWEILAIFLISSGLITWLIQSLGKYFIDKRFKSFENELEKKIIERQHKLENITLEFKHQIQLTEKKKELVIHERFNTYTEVYQLLFDLTSKLKTLTAFLKPVIEDFEKEEYSRIKEVAESYNKIRTLFSSKEYFFDKNTSKMINEVINKSFDILFEHDYSFKYKDFNKETRERSVKLIDKVIPDLLDNIRSEFKVILSIDDKQEML